MKCNAYTDIIQGQTKERRCHERIQALSLKGKKYPIFYIGWTKIIAEGLKKNWSRQAVRLKKSPLRMVSDLLGLLNRLELYYLENPSELG